MTACAETSVPRAAASLPVLPQAPAVGCSALEVAVETTQSSFGSQMWKQSLMRAVQRACENRCLRSRSLGSPRSSTAHALYHYWARQGGNLGHETTAMTGVNSDQACERAEMQRQTFDVHLPQNQHAHIYWQWKRRLQGICIILFCGYHQKGRQSSRLRYITSHSTHAPPNAPFSMQSEEENGPTHQSRS